MRYHVAKSMETMSHIKLLAEDTGNAWRYDAGSAHRDREMRPQKFTINLLAILFICAGIAYTSMGFGKSIDIHEGQGGIFRVDRKQSIQMAEFMLNGDFGFYSREMIDADMLSAPGGKYNYPPVTAIMEVPILLWGRALGSTKNDIFNISIFPFILFSGLSVLLIGSIFERYSREHMTNDGAILIGIFLFSGLLFYSVVKEGKFEGVIAFFVLLGIFLLPRNKVLSGISFGLAVCTKQTAILFVIPTFFVLCQEKGYKDVMKWSLSLALCVLLIMMPFILGSGMGRVYLSLLKNMDLFGIQEHTLIGYIYRLTAFVTGGERETFKELLQMYANMLVLLICVLASFLFAFKKKISLSTPKKYFALLGFCSFLFIVLGKYYTSGIYEVAPTYIFILWAIMTRETLFGAIMLLLQSFLCRDWSLQFYRDQMLLLLYFITILYIWHASLAGKNEDAPASS